jgi:hypothetical protein
MLLIWINPDDRDFEHNLHQFSARYNARIEMVNVWIDGDMREGTTPPHLLAGLLEFEGWRYGMNRIGRIEYGIRL